MNHLRLILAIPLLLLAACSTPVGTRTAEAVSIVRGFQSSEHPIPSAVFERAKGVAILRETSGALVVGGAGAEGVFLKRAGAQWSAPVAINTASASIGLQAGGQSRDIVLVLNTDAEVEKLLADGLFGLAEADAVAGPSKTDENNSPGALPANYYYVRRAGLFGGLLVGGVYFSVAEGVNEDTYGPDVTARDIVDGKVKPPPGTSILWQALN